MGNSSPEMSSQKLVSTTHFKLKFFDSNDYDWDSDSMKMKKFIHYADNISYFSNLEDSS